MIKKHSLILTTSAMLFILSGCVQNDFALPSGSSKHSNTQAPSWNTQSSEEDGENIDISDLDEGISESELGMTEEVVEPKIKRIPFPVSEYNSLAKLGKGTVKGTIYVTAPNGNKVAWCRDKTLFEPCDFIL